MKTLLAVLAVLAVTPALADPKPIEYEDDLDAEAQTATASRCITVIINGAARTYCAPASPQPQQPQPARTCIKFGVVYPC